MDFRTQIPENRSYNQITYDSDIVLLGSCFSKNIGSVLNDFKFRTAINPFGVLFHPIAIERIITHSINEKQYLDEDLFFLNERWHCFDVHSELSATSKDALLKKLNETIKGFCHQLQKASHIIITLGTAWVYRLISDDLIVANCHKVPQKKFLKELLSVDEISESLEATIKLIRDHNKHVEIVITVSPIRHLKDGFVENSLSKSHLISGIHQIIDKRQHINYFPSYEMMMDDLRDYRFYKKDMIHPNEVAIEYIWEYFKKTWIDEKEYTLIDMVGNVIKGLAHQPFNKESESHKQFLSSLDDKIKELEDLIPHAVFK